MKRSLTFLGDEVLHRSEPILYKIGSRMTALAGVHLGERGGGGGTGVVCGIYPPMYISMKPVFLAHF